MSCMCKVWFWVVRDEENIMVKERWGRIWAHYFLYIKPPPPPRRFSSFAANVQKLCLRTYSIPSFNSNHTECHQCYRVLSPSHFMFIILCFVSHYYYYYQLISFRSLVFNLFCINCPLTIIKWININNAYYVFFWFCRRTVIWCLRTIKRTFWTVWARTTIISNRRPACLTSCTVRWNGWNDRYGRLSKTKIPRRPIRRTSLFLRRRPVPLAPPRWGEIKKPIC